MIKGIVELEVITGMLAFFSSAMPSGGFPFKISSCSSAFEKLPFFLNRKKSQKTKKNEKNQKNQKMKKNEKK